MDTAINLLGPTYVPRLKKEYDLSQISNHIRLMVDAVDHANNLDWFEIDMHTYFEPIGQSTCVGCAATSLLISLCKIDDAYELNEANGAKIGDRYIVGGFNWNDVEDWYDSLRSGYIGSYDNLPHNQIGNDIDYDRFFDSNLPEYESNPTKWRESVLSWADALDVYFKK
jgi:hypothetical protein